MKNRQYEDFIQDIFDSITDIEKFIIDTDYNSFSKDRKTIFAVVRAIEIIREATKNIPISVRNKYPNVPWKKMAGMRDRLIHAYFNIDLEILWKVITEDIYIFKPLIRQIIDDMDETTR